MATTTPNFGWDIPQSTDLVKDGATAIAALGTDIDTAFVDLKGGTTGQVLSKNSNTDLDFTWVAQDDSNAIQNALLTTTGDTIYASGASTPARLGIGTSGQVLTVSGGVPTWATPASGGMTLISTTTINNAEVLLSSIPATYNNLVIVIRDYLPTTDGQPLRMRFNDDSNANRHSTTGLVTATLTFSETYVSITDTLDDTLADNLHIITIPDYTNTTTFKFMLSNGIGYNSDGVTFKGYFQKGAYNQTGAISSLRFLNASSVPKSGTILLYGVK